MGAMRDIRERYSIPARRGMRVRYRPDPDEFHLHYEGTILGPSEDGAELRIKFDAIETIQTVHPTTRLEYLDREPSLEDAHETPD